MAWKNETVNVKQFVIKPEDIGYDTEASAELAQASRRTYGKTSTENKSCTTSTRPPIMLHPGE